MDDDWYRKKLEENNRWYERESARINEVYECNTRLIDRSALLSLALLFIFILLAFTVNDYFIFGFLVSMLPIALGYPLFKKSYNMDNERE